MRSRGHTKRLYAAIGHMLRLALTVPVSFADSSMPFRGLKSVRELIRTRG